MRPRGKRGYESLFVFLLFIAFTLFSNTGFANAATDAGTCNALSLMLRDRALQEVDRIRPLVENGTVAKSQLDLAESRLADAQDELILSQTLYAENRVENMTESDVTRMIGAARRRVDREQALLAERQLLLDSGIISRAEFQKFQDELHDRRRVLDLAENRKKLLEDLQHMADNEKQLERASQANASSLQTAMVRFDGNGHFTLDDLPTISSEYRKHFNRDLPISALGQTQLHQSMLLDHRNRVDVPVSPDAPEGVWLRHLLERLRVPYLAFRSAVNGAATAPHIHIGLESTRLKIVSR